MSKFNQIKILMFILPYLRLIRDLILMQIIIINNNKNNVLAQITIKNFYKLLIKTVN